MSRPGGRDDRIEVVVLTYNRPDELANTLSRLSELPERPRIHVVDNASRPSVDEVARRFPTVDYLALSSNIGAAGRNIGVARATSPYIALCDDDTWYEAGSLSRAASILDAHPRVASLTARVLVGQSNRLDRTCEEMARSPLPSGGLPGPALLGFLAGATVVRRDAFLAAGGFEPRFFLGGEEELLALDLRAAGWRLTYADELVVHHHASPLREPKPRRVALMRNRLWVTWLRRPLPLALARTASMAREAVRYAGAREALTGALRGLPWALRRRRPLPPDVEAELRLLERWKRANALGPDTRLRISRPRASGW